MQQCKAIGCDLTFQSPHTEDYCPQCRTDEQTQVSDRRIRVDGVHLGTNIGISVGSNHSLGHFQLPANDDPNAEMARKYPKYHRPLPANWKSVDTYRINQLFPVDDASGVLLHARKKLLIPGVRTGKKSMRDDILEARDQLNIWLANNP